MNMVWLYPIHAKKSIVGYFASKKGQKIISKLFGSF